MACLAAVAKQQPGIIKNMIRQKGNGIYEVVLHFQGKEHIITVDNRFPSLKFIQQLNALDDETAKKCMEKAQGLIKRSAAASPRSGSWYLQEARKIHALLHQAMTSSLFRPSGGLYDSEHFWFAIVEKAFAKHLGGYEADGFQSDFALSAITGQPAYEVAEGPSKIAEYLGQGYCITATNSREDGDRSTPTHCWAICEVDYNEDDPDSSTIVLFDPHNQKDAKNLAYPYMGKYKIDGEDGMFRMPWTEFLVHFPMNTSSRISSITVAFVSTLLPCCPNPERQTETGKDRRECSKCGHAYQHGAYEKVLTLKLNSNYCLKVNRDANLGDIKLGVFQKRPEHNTLTRADICDISIGDRLDLEAIITSPVHYFDLPEWRSGEKCILFPGGQKRKPDTELNFGDIAVSVYVRKSYLHRNPDFKLTVTEQ